MAPVRAIQPEKFEIDASEPKSLTGSRSDCFQFSCAAGLKNFFFGFGIADDQMCPAFCEVKNRPGRKDQS